MGRVVMLVAAFGVAVVGFAGMASSARADGVEVGGNAGLILPINKYERSVHKDVGGTFGLTGGYRWDLSENFALSLIGQPQFTFVSSQECCGSNDDEMGSMFILTAGPKFSFVAGAVELFLTGQGGYYRDMSGPMSEDGGGFNAGGGLNFRLTPDDLLGVWARYDYADMVACPDCSVERQFALTGIGYTHVFRPRPVVARAVPPPPPPPPARAVPPAYVPPPAPRTERRGG